MLQTSPSRPTPGESDTAKEEGLTVFKHLRLGFSRQYYAMANVLGLKRIQEYLQGASPLLASAGPVWILGEQYANPPDATGEELHEEVMSRILLDFTSRPWMTYRRGFLPLGPDQQISDVGWGCTLRSGQMLLSQVLTHHLHGRQWRRQQAALQSHSDLATLLGWFWDSPAAAHPFSIHSLVEAGRSHGVKAGEWLGPWTLCLTLREAVNRSRVGGLQVHLVNTPGGVAPVLYTASVDQIFGKDQAEQGDGLQNGVLLLIPLVLGIGKVNPRYVPQLQAVLRFPQSAGIVGGRPSSSLYFVGYQDSHVLFLDPHQVQEAGTSPSEGLETYFCDAPRTMPIASIDPSLAIAFYCRSRDSLQDLAVRLQALEAEAEGAPLLNIVEGEPPPPFAERSSSMEEGGAKGEEQWELL